MCADCSKGQYPADAELGVAGLESSPGVRRMEAVVGSEMPFAPGCEPMKLRAGLDVTAKAIERAAEAIGTQIGQRDEQEIGRAKQLVLPVIGKQNIPKMYVLMDGVQVPVVAAETEGRAGRIEGQRAHTRECKLGCVFMQTTVDEEGWPIREPDSTTYVGAIETAEEFGFRIYTEAWRRGWEWATIKVIIGDGAGLDLESRQPALSRRHPNRGSVSCPAAFMENSGPTSPSRSNSEKRLDDSHEGSVG